MGEPRVGVALLLASCAALAGGGCTLPFDERPPGCDPFVDDFADGVPAEVWQTNSFDTPPTTAEETGGELVITLGGGDGFAGYLSDDLDFTDHAATVRVVETPNPATGAQAFLKIEFPYPATAMVIVENGMLRARLFSTGGDLTDLESVPFDAAAHRFWRLRHRDGMLEWQVSPNGSDFTTLASRSGLDLRQARYGMVAGTYQPETEPGRARFADFSLTCF